MAKGDDQARVSSFKLMQEVTIEAPRERVWDALTTGIDRWWRFRQGGDGSEVTLDARVGGHFAETWGPGSGALWGVVLYIDAPAVLRLAGPLGMQTANSNHYSFELEEKGESSTLLKLTHHAVGDMDEKVEQDYGQGWGKLFNTYLKSFLERDKDWRAVDAESE
jgi:uncharacterized protein YndB with AHSA1/START domain